VIPDSLIAKRDLQQYPSESGRTAPLVSNAEWKRWGAADPLWGVASWAGKQRGGSDPWNDQEFYALGKSEWLYFLKRWESYGVDRTSCVEIGCGAGRITAHLSKDFAAVYALDVSEGMLNYAKARIDKTTFYLTDGIRIPLHDSSATAAFSCHVLQHLDSPEESISIFAEIHRVLTSGSTMMIHLPTYNWPLSRAIFERTFRIRQWLSRRKAALYRTWGRPLMRGTWYEMEWLARILGEHGFVDIEFLSFLVTSNRGLHPCVLARKSS
jgi:ubiquinone/menaquinone biosynthesis C-methylase UbiE